MEVEGARWERLGIRSVDAMSVTSPSALEIPQLASLSCYDFGQGQVTGRLAFRTPLSAMDTETEADIQSLVFRRSGIEEVVSRHDEERAARSSPFHFSGQVQPLAQYNRVSSHPSFTSNAAYDLLHPRIHAGIGWRVAHVEQPRVESSGFRRAILHHQHTVLDGHQPIVRAVDQ